MKPLRLDVLDKLTQNKKREFSRWCALRVADKWDAPHTMRRYLETGDEALREGAVAAACDNVRDYAYSTAWVVRLYLETGDVAARDAARDAARAAAWGAAWGAARAAARAADDTAAERDAQNAKLVEMAGVS